MGIVSGFLGLAIKVAFFTIYSINWALTWILCKVGSHPQAPWTLLRRSNIKRMEDAAISLIKFAEAVKSHQFQMANVEFAKLTPEYWKGVSEFLSRYQYPDQACDLNIRIEIINRNLKKALEIAKGYEQLDIGVAIRLASASILPEDPYWKSAPLFSSDFIEVYSVRRVYGDCTNSHYAQIYIMYRDNERVPGPPPSPVWRYPLALTN